MNTLVYFHLDQNITSFVCRDSIIYLLHCVGAQRCRIGVKGCREGCGDGYFFDGVPKGVSSPDPEDHTSHVKSKFSSEEVNVLSLLPKKKKKKKKEKKIDLPLAQDYK